MLACRSTALGPIGIEVRDGAVVQLILNCRNIPDDAETPPNSEAAADRDGAILAQAFRELDEYLAGQRTRFTIPLSPSGTPFQLRVWEELCRVPYGETASYREIATQIGCPGGCRAVGLANNRNPIAIFIPCHRIIGADGKLVGYAGGIEMKVRLLRLEGAVDALL